ncbi:unnamed protein product [Heterobilharzia americana]|nr:unnamed protein product [Heterobilharzia americana]
MSHTSVITLNVTQARESNEFIVVTVEANPHRIPVYMSKPTPLWNIPRSLDFGILVQENKVITKILPIENQGSQTGTFRILNTSSPSIAIVPRFGRVGPFSHTDLKVTFIPKKIQDFMESVRFELEETKFFNLEITGKVIKPEFRITSCRTVENSRGEDDAPISHWNFGYVYYNTDVSCTWNLVNYSPRDASFAASFYNKNDSKSTNNTGIENPSKSEKSDSPIQLSEYFGINPDHGELKPFEKLPVSVCLAPRWKKSKQGFVSLNESPPVKPFSVYLRIRKVDLGAGDWSNKEELKNSTRSSFVSDDKSNLEIIITGCLIPVQLLISPVTQQLDVERQVMSSDEGSSEINMTIINENIKIKQLYENQLSVNFPACLIGLKECGYLKLSNQSKHLPIHFRIPRIAHFTVTPDKGVIRPLKACPIVVSFSPKQFVKFNPGIVPKWAHEVGRNTDLVTFGSDYECPRAAIISLMSMKSLRGLQSHVSRSEPLTKMSTKVTFPNDRYTSIRPTNKQEEFKTLFCRLTRYTYTDPDYEWNKEESNEIFKRQLTYADVYRNHAQLIERIQEDRKLMKWNESPDDGVVFMELDRLSPKLKIEKFEEFKQVDKIKSINQTKSTRSARKSMKKKAEKVLPLKMVTKSKVNEECNKTLSVKDIDEISIYPTKVEFQNICPNTESTQFITITNPLKQCISFKLDTDLDEFKPTDIREYIVQPKSSLDIPIRVKISKLCNFQCNLDFSVNDRHKSNLVVCATVVPVQLTLSSSTIELTSANLSYGLIKVSGMRGYVTLINPLHAPARFLWQSSGVQNPFTICPKTGIVEPFSSLNCELLRVDEKHAGTSPSAINDLSGHHKDIELLCRAKLLPSKLSFSTRRLPLGSLAHGLPCTRQITIFNLGQNSVLFNINKESKNVNINGDITSYMHRLSGALPAKVDMQVDPSEGEIPVSGEITLKVTCVPIGLGKFESSMVLSTYDGQNIDLSVCGTVLKPEIELISNLYEFGGVRVGSMKSLPLGIINHGITRVLIEIDLKSYDEFQISDCVNSFSADEYMNERINTNETKVSTRSQLSNLSNCDQLEKHSMISIANPHSHSYLEFDSESNVYHIFVSPRTKWVGSIIYKPKVVSFHDFTLPLVINKLHPKLISQKFGQTNSDQERPASETEANSKLITEEYEAQDPGLINSRMKEMKYTSNLNISTIYKLFDEIKFSQKEFLDTEDTSSDRTSNLGSNVRQQSVGKCTYGLTDSNNNIRDIASSPITGINPSGNLEDSDQPRSSPSTTATRRTNWYGSCIFLPDWQLIDRAATEQVQRWLCVHGFPVGRYPLKFPDDFRNCISLTATISDISIMGDKQKSNPKFTQNALPNESNQSVSLRRNNNQPSETVSRSLNPLYNCLQHLCCNKQPPGLLPSINLPIDNPYEALSTVYFYCSALLTFARSQGSCLPHILPEHLMEPNDYRLWYKYGCPGLTESARTVCTSMSQSLNTIPTTDFEKPQAANYGSKQNNYDSIKIDLCLLSESTVERFLIISERAWTDLMLQIIKCLLFNRITTSSLDLITLPPKVLRLNQTCSLSSTSSSASCPHQNESSRSDQVVAHAVRLPAKNNSIQKSKPTHLNDTQVNSCYSPCERILLAWLNYCYHQYACQIWPERKSVFKDSWIVTNFDNDLRDGIVLASTIGAYIPSLIPNYLSKMYTQPTSNEQCFHNAIIVVQALRVIRFEYDLYPSDLTSPHPFGMSLLCLHLSCQLPDYLPKQTIHFTGLLNSTTKRQLVITNTSSHTLTYYCVIIGPNAIDFTCTLSGNLNKSTKRENNKVHTNRNEAKKSKRSADYNVTVNNSNEQLCNNVKEMRITISPKGKIQLCIEYKSRFLKPTEAIFLAVSQRQNTFQGKNLSFLLSGSVGGLEMLPVKVVKSPCYQMTEFKLPVINPYKLDGIFQITVIESRSDLFNSLCQVQGLNTITKESHSENILASETYSVTERSSFDQSSENSQLPPEILKEYYQRTQYQSFYCRELTIQLSGNVNNTSTNLYPIKQSTSEDSKVQQKYDSYIRNLSEVSIVYLPLGWGTRECCLLLSNDKIGEFVMLLKGIAQLPQPSLLPFSDFQNDLNTEKSPTQKERGYRIRSAVAAASFGRSGDPNVIYLRCPLGCEVQETLLLPVKNELRRTALLNAIRIRLPPSEVRRRQIANTLESDELLELANKELILPNYEESASGKRTKPQKRLHMSRHLLYTVEIDSNMIQVPSKIQVPLQTDSDSDSTFPLPLKIVADKPGVTSAKLVLQGPDDIRLYRIECVVLPGNEKIVLTFTSPLNHPITQPLPIVNKTAYDWELVSKFVGYPIWFTGPSVVNIPSNTTVQYPITYLPRREAESHTKLILRNMTDGSQLQYHLNGTVLKPMSLGKISLEFTISACEVREGICKISKQTHLQTFSVKIPNSTSIKQSFQLQTNLPKGLIEWIPNSQKPMVNCIEVMSGRTDDCKFQVSASKRGCYRGVLVFVANARNNNSDSDDEDGNDGQLKLNPAYRIWYEIEINIKPGPPIKQVEVVCPCLSCKTIELPFTLQLEWFTNSQTIEFDVTIDDKCLSGAKIHSLHFDDNSGKSSSVYRLEYTPSIIGVSNAAVIFHNPNCGEFWIELILRAIKPESVNVPLIEAELGSSKVTKIVLNNPTDEFYILKPKLFNTEVFKLQLATSASQLANITSSKASGIDDVYSHLQNSTICQYTEDGLLALSEDLKYSSQASLINRSASSTLDGIIKLKPKSTLYLGLKFTPCAIGEAEHQGSIVFHSEKLTEWCFMLFWQRQASQHKYLFNFSTFDETTKNIPLKSKTVFEIPISYAPIEMREHEALCTVIMHKSNSTKCGSSKVEKSSSIRWLIPIKGIPEMKSLSYPLSDSRELTLPYYCNYNKNAFRKPLVINGTVRSKSYYIVTLRLLNSLTHTSDQNLSFRDQMKDIEVHSLTSKEERSKFDEQMFGKTAVATTESLFNQSALWEQIQVGNLEWTMKPVIKKEDEPLAKLIELDKVLVRSLNMKLLQVKKHDDLEFTELDVGMIFSPSLSFKCSADLMVRTCLGGIWKFGLIFKSKDPPVDDTIYFPHRGIGRSVKVHLALNSQLNEPLKFIATLYPEIKLNIPSNPSLTDTDGENGMALSTNRKHPSIQSTEGEAASDHIRHLNVEKQPH